jgi:hypothetical protein
VGGEVGRGGPSPTGVTLDSAVESADSTTEQTTWRTDTTSTGSQHTGCSRCTGGSSLTRSAQDTNRCEEAEFGFGVSERRSVGHRGWELTGR